MLGMDVFLQPCRTDIDTDIDTDAAPADARASAAREPTASSPARVPVREVGVRHRAQILWHLLQLGPQDRYLRFGHAASDEQIRHYVEALDFERDRVLGVFNRKLELIALAHLAQPREVREVREVHEVHEGTTRFVELGVSVSPHARGRGYGTLLFERAALYAVNQGIDTLYIQALSENAAMLHIARKAGAQIERLGSESEAYLRLPEASFRTRLDQLLADHVGHVDYWLKTEASTLRDVLTGKRGDDAL